jgi:tetratricopeptide (TPR) repeat protein
LELAIALSVTSGPGEALKVLEQTPEAERGGDYLLLRARLLDASGQKVEAEKALQAGLRQSSSRPQVAQQAALLLLSRDRQKEALLLLEQSIHAAPSNADLRLMRAIVLGLMGRTQEAESALKETESRWPEWDRPYLVHGLLLEGAGRKAEARQKLQTVIALNPQDLAARCALARLAVSAAPEARCACVGGLRELLFPSCGESVVR